MGQSQVKRGQIQTVAIITNAFGFVFILLLAIYSKLSTPNTVLNAVLEIVTIPIIILIFAGFVVSLWNWVANRCRIISRQFASFALALMNVTMIVFLP
jgi:protein-S-isoprenylcysteine O-methyltransferase Ste14